MAALVREAKYEIEGGREVVPERISIHHKNSKNDDGNQIPDTKRVGQCVLFFEDN